MSSQGYKDYPDDTTLIQEQVSPSHGIIGCEMHEINGWGTDFYYPRKPKKGIWASIIRFFISEEHQK